MKPEPKKFYIVSGVVIFAESEKARKKRQRCERLAVVRMVLWPYSRTGTPLMIFMWLILLYLAIVGWIASLNSGEAIFLQFVIAMWAIQIAIWISASLNAWRHHLAYSMYFDDIERGVCPDRGAQIAERNAWVWYVKQGKPLWIRRKHASRID